jgi:hypothetical protein
VTGLVGIFLGLSAGWLVANRRHMALAVVLPFLVILGVQTWRLAAGDGVSPPSTVTAFPGLIGYYVVQLITLGLALGVADQIRTRRHPATSDRRFAETDRRQLTAALVANVVWCGAVVLAFRLDRHLFDPGSVTTHTGNGSPPVFGVLGILSSVVVFAALGAMSLRRRWTQRRPSGAPQSIS